MGHERLNKDGINYAADIMRNYDDKVSKLLDAGIEVLIYVGVGELMLQTSYPACSEGYEKSGLAFWYQSNTWEFECLWNLY